MKCKVCGKEQKTLRKDGTCYASGRYSSETQCYERLCECGSAMKEIDSHTTYGCSCDQYGTTVKALCCFRCKKGKILEIR